MDERLEAYTHRSYDKLRYGDTDRQGHVNNADFATFLETGRVEILYDETHPVIEPGASFVIASLRLEFLRELLWPGIVDIGTRVTRLGRSSVTIAQGLFKDGVCVATAETVIVQTDDATRRSKPLSPRARERLTELMTT